MTEEDNAGQLVTLYPKAEGKKRLMPEPLILFIFTLYSATIEMCV